MCGIVGAVAQRDVAPILLEGLKRLEYRGYDSAGIAIIDKQNKLERCRVLGKVKKLKETLEKHPINGVTGIAHTRWATHGAPCEQNAHPHTSNEEIALVHNGIIENFVALREQLIKDGYQLTSETDTEVIVHMIHQQLTKHKTIIAALRYVASCLEGAFALGIIFKKHPEKLYAIRCGSPLVIGVGIGENFIASDQLALLPVTQRFIYLADGDVAELTRNGYQIFDAENKVVEREVNLSTLTSDTTERGHFRHYMQKEIFDQPDAVSATLQGRLGKKGVLDAIFGDKATKLFDEVKQIQIVACGTSYHAGLVARHWFESMVGIPCQVEVASEFRYRKRVKQNNALFVTISQSGETADTLAALREAKTTYLSSLAICNVPESSLVRESDLVFMTRAGVEIGVASTKAFTTQLTALLMLAITIGRRHNISAEQELKLVEQLKSLPLLIKKVLELDKSIQTIANKFIDKQHALFLGRGDQYPIALEGALKLKEISYIHAEAYPAGELKHGPLALVDNKMPVIALATNNHLIEKLKSNLEEVRTRGGELIIFADETVVLQESQQTTILALPKTPAEIAPIVYTIPLQLLAYHVAVLKGTDVDQPRNLAKSVTVE